MASFKALNIESDDDSDDEIDNTKEIQIEDALKDYQSALKLQSQGPLYSKETGDAYKALFASEIFKYPESLSQYQRIETADIHIEDENDLLDGVDTTGEVPSGVVDSTSSALPQILHLSYKNRGEYYLELLKTLTTSQHENAHGANRVSIPNEVQPVETAINALNDFSEALDKDEGDTDLWRRSSRVARTLGSTRTARYCLESAIEADEEGVDEVLGIPNIDVSLAGYELQDLERNVEDGLSLLQQPDSIASCKGPKFALKKHLNPYPFLSNLKLQRTRPENISSERNVLLVHEANWTAVGEAIWQHLCAEQGSILPTSLSSAIYLQLPLQGHHTVENSSGNSAALSLPPNIDSLCREDSGTIKSPDLSEQAIHQSPTILVEAITQQDAPLTNGMSRDDASTTTSLPLRKRSVEIAEIPETPDGVRIRSKRIRARESNIGDSSHAETTGVECAMDDEKIQSAVTADHWLFEVLRDIMKKTGVEAFGNAQEFRNAVGPSNLRTTKDISAGAPLLQAMSDFYNTMQTWNESKTQMLQRDPQEEDAAGNTRNADFLVYLEHTKAAPEQAEPLLTESGIQNFVNTINNGFYTAVEAALAWTRSMLHSQPSSLTPPSQDESQSSYTAARWPESLKQAVVRMISAVDEILFDDLLEFSRLFSEQILTSQTHHQISTISTEDLGTIEMIQTIFELHLDIYSCMTNSASKVDDETRLLEKTCLEKWRNLAHEVISLRLETTSEHLKGDKVILRHFWASVCHLQASKDTAREYLKLCIEDIKRIWISLESPVIELPNNVVMPELSIAAANKEISDLETMDFFLKIFRTDNQSPVDLIESLEPVLDASTIKNKPALCNGMSLPHGSEPKSPEGQELTSSEILTSFIAGAGTSLRLSLYRRLMEAYQAIEYPSKILSILLRSVELIMEELSSAAYMAKEKEARELLCLDRVRELGKLVEAALTITEKHPSDAFECIDLEHLRSSLAAVGALSTLLYAVTLYDDYSQIGLKGQPMMNPFRCYPTPSFHPAAMKFHNTQIHTWILMYRLLQEATSQMSENFSNPEEDRLDYLRRVHHSLGVRRLCKASDGLFLNFMKEELSKMPTIGSQKCDDFAQILYDMYDLNCFSSPTERQDHGCEPDYLDRSTALQLVDFVMEKARQYSMKDLLKSEVGRAIDRLHSALGGSKSSLSSFATARNRKIYNAYMKSPINPLDLYRCMKGIGDLSAIPVAAEEAIVASKGWYFLKGQIALAKYRSQRSKGAPGPTEDLHIAITFFVQDLEYSMERWQTWYRIAQAYDALIEEHVLWSAEKINTGRLDLAQEQRASIHAYTMATATAIRSTRSMLEDEAKLAELYSDFGARLYSSSRPPFSMQAFSLKTFPDKQCSGPVGNGGLYTRRAFKNLKSPNAWKVAAALVKRAIRLKPSSWGDHFLLGKCVWKLYGISVDFGVCCKPTPLHLMVGALDAFVRAVETTPERKDTTRQDPILEPIYKVVSVVHKLVDREELEAESGASVIESVLIKQRQFEIQNFPLLADFDSWQSYVLDVLRVLRAADKSRWHHRLVFRAARILYDKHHDGTAGARLAKDYLIEQHLYSTKTLALTVWKPDHERPGRHWIYMTQYARFIILLLEETDDLEAMQILARRVRRKVNEFFEHEALWDELCTAHLRLHRRHGNILEHFDDVVFKNVTQEELEPRAALIDQWTASSKTSHPLSQVLHETVELKKLNAGLMKGSAFDEVIIDTYAHIYDTIVPTLEIAKRASHTASAPAPLSAPTSPSTDDRRNVMSLTNLMNLDGAIDMRLAAFNPNSIPPTPLMPATQPEPTKPRSRPVLRRDIIKRATDAVSAKPAPQPAARAHTPPRRQPTDSGVRVVVGAPIDVISPRSERAEGLNVSVNEGAVLSAPGSVHDDADDESELSEIEAEEEAVVKQPMFPNLKPREVSIQGAAGVDGEVVAEEEAQGGGDGDVEMGEL